MSDRTVKDFKDVDPNTLLHKITVKIDIEDSLRLSALKFLVDQIRSQLRKQPLMFHISIDGEEDRFLREKVNRKEVKT